MSNATVSLHWTVQMSAVYCTVCMYSTVYIFKLKLWVLYTVQYCNSVMLVWFLSSFGATGLIKTMASVPNIGPQLRGELVGAKVEQRAASERTIELLLQQTGWNDIHESPNFPRSAASTLHFLSCVRRRGARGLRNRDRWCRCCYRRKKVYINGAGKCYVKWLSATFVRFVCLFETKCTVNLNARMPDIVKMWFNKMFNN